MDASLMFSAPAMPSPAHASHATPTASHAAPPSLGVETSSPPGRPSPSANGRIFAGLMRGLLPTHERQDVAAEVPHSGTESGDLKTEVLGDQINVITTSNAQPDPGSLSAFAKAQGLDEAAVKALFGDIEAQGAAPVDATAVIQNITLGVHPTDTALPPNMQTTSADLAWLASQLSAEISMQISGLKSQPNNPSTPGAKLSAALTSDSPPPVMMDWAAMANAASTLSANPTPNGLSDIAALSVTPAGMDGFRASGLTPIVNPLTTNTLTSAPLTSAPLIPAPSTSAPSTSAPLIPAPLIPAPLIPAPLLSAGQAPTALAVTLPSPRIVNDPTREALTSPLAAAAELDSLAPIQPQPEDVMRIRLVPAWAMVTQQLTQMSGTAATSAWGALTATTLGAPIRSVALDLTSPLAADNEEASSLNGTESAWTTQGSDTARPNQISPALPSMAPPPGMAQTLRQEHYQQLAHRLGQAMAERLQSQIARGEWKLQMRLNPANLGRIDVELDMHAKGLDAMFRSENPLTRELMVHSMPKLKDSLSQSGMAVASVWVNSDAGRQSDGNPTPQKDRETVTDTPISASAEVEAAPATNPKRNQDGFDVLA